MTIADARWLILAGPELLQTIIPLLERLDVACLSFSRGEDVARWLATHQDPVCGVLFEPSGRSADCIEQVATLRSGLKDRRLPIVVLAKVTTPRDSQSLISHGADSVLPLPIDMRQLETTLRVVG